MKEKIYLKKDGRYELRYHYGYKEDGSANYRSIYGLSEKEVLEKYRKRIKEYLVNQDLLCFDKTYFGYVIHTWLENAKIKNKKSTYSCYQYILFSRIVPKFAGIKRDVITESMINSFTSSLIEEGLSPKSIKDILILLQQILHNGDIPIKISMPKVPKKEIQILTKEEQYLVEKEVLTTKDLYSIGIFLCLYTGLRIGEVCALRWKDIDLVNKKIYVRKTAIRIKNPGKENNKKTIVVLDTPKSFSSIREIPISSFLLSVLLSIKKEYQDDVFLLSGSEKMIETRLLFTHYKKIMKKIGLEKYNFHALRHTFATRCIEIGSDPKTLSEILGHANVKVTLDRYVHPSYENKVNLMNQLHPFYERK